MKKAPCIYGQATVPMWRKAWQMFLLLLLHMTWGSSRNNPSFLTVVASTLKPETVNILWTLIYDLKGIGLLCRTTWRHWLVLGSSGIGWRVEWKLCLIYIFPFKRGKKPERQNTLELTPSRNISRLAYFQSPETAKWTLQASCSSINIILSKKRWKSAADLFLPPWQESQIRQYNLALEARVVVPALTHIYLFIKFINNAFCPLQMQFFAFSRPVDVSQFDAHLTNKHAVILITPVNSNIIVHLEDT